MSELRSAALTSQPFALGMLFKRKQRGKKVRGSVLFSSPAELQELLSLSGCFLDRAVYGAQSWEWLSRMGLFLQC